MKDKWIIKAKEHYKSAKVLYDDELFRDSLSRLYYSAFSLMVAIVGKPDSEKGRWEHKGILRPLFNLLYLNFEEWQTMKPKLLKRKMLKHILNS